MTGPVLTLDSSPSFTGWALVYDGVPIQYGCIKSKEMSPTEFAAAILEVVLIALSFGCVWCLAERPFKGKSIGTYGDSKEVIGMWKGIWLAEGARGGLCVLFDEIPSSVWRTILGPEGPKLKRAASKIAARRLVMDRFGMGPRGKGVLRVTTDTAEAICFGLWAGTSFNPEGDG